MGGHRAAERSAEAELAERGERVGVDLGGRRGLHQGQHPPGVADHVGVGGVLHHAHVGDHVGRWQLEARQPAEQRPAGLRFGEHALGAHPTVAVSGAGAVEANAVQHRVAIEEVVGTTGSEQGVGSVAHVGAHQGGRQLADHLEAVGVDLIMDRSVLAEQVGHLAPAPVRQRPIAHR